MQYVYTLEPIPKLVGRGFRQGVIIFLKDIGSTSARWEVANFPRCSDKLVGNYVVGYVVPQHATVTSSGEVDST